MLLMRMINIILFPCRPISTWASSIIALVIITPSFCFCIENKPIYPHFFTTKSICYTIGIRKKYIVCLASFSHSFRIFRYHESFFITINGSFCKSSQSIVFFFAKRYFYRIYIQHSTAPVLCGTVTNSSPLHVDNDNRQINIS